MNIESVLRIGARPSAIASLLGSGRYRSSSIFLAGWLLTVYVTLAIAPGLLFFVSLFPPTLEDAIFKHPTDYLTVAVGSLTTGLGFVGLFIIPG